MQPGKTTIACLLAVGAADPAASYAQAISTERYPVKPIRLIVALTAGGPTDILARLIAQPLGESLGQQVIVDNRPGAGGNIGAAMAAHAVPDGYTLFMGTSGPLSINNSIYSKTGYDPIKDFAPIALVASAPFVIVAHPSVPAANIKELIQLARAKPGSLTYGSVPGNASHLATELFRSMTGIDLVFIPYKGAAQATIDLLAGQIQLSWASTPGSVPQVKAGKLKALAVTSMKRIAQLPGIATVAESGVPGYEANVWYGVVAPARTPPEIVSKLHGEIARIVEQRSNRERIVSNDFEPTLLKPGEFGVLIRRESDKWAKGVKSSGAKVD